MKPIDWKFGIESFCASTILAKDLNLSVSSDSVSPIASFAEWISNIPIYSVISPSGLVASLMNYSYQVTDPHDAAITLYNILKSPILQEYDRASLVFETQMAIVIVNCPRSMTSGLPKRQLIIPKITRSLRTLLENHEFITPCEPDVHARPVHEQIIVINDQNVYPCLALITRVIAEEASIEQDENTLANSDYNENLMGNGSLQASVGLPTLRHITTNFPFPNLTIRVPQPIIRTNPNKTCCNVTWYSPTVFLPIQVDGLIRDLYERHNSFQSLMTLKLEWQMTPAMVKIFEDVNSKLVGQKNILLPDYIFLRMGDQLITQDNASQTSLLKRLTLPEQPRPATPVIKLPTRRQAKGRRAPANKKQAIEARNDQIVLAGCELTELPDVLKLGLKQLHGKVLFFLGKFHHADVSSVSFDVFIKACGFKNSASETVLLKILRTRVDIFIISNFLYEEHLEFADVLLGSKLDPPQVYKDIVYKLVPVDRCRTIQWLKDLDRAVRTFPEEVQGRYEPTRWLVDLDSAHFLCTSLHRPMYHVDGALTYDEGFQVSRGLFVLGVPSRPHDDSRYLFVHKEVLGRLVRNPMRNVLDSGQTAARMLRPLLLRMRDGDGADKELPHLVRILIVLPRGVVAEEGGGVIDRELFQDIMEDADHLIKLQMEFGENLIIVEFVSSLWVEDCLDNTSVDYRVYRCCASVESKLGVAGYS